MPLFVPLLGAPDTSEDQATLARAMRDRATIQSFASARELLHWLRAAHIAHWDIGAVVLDLDSPGLRAMLPAIIGEIGERPEPLLLRLTMTNLGMRAILLCVDAGVNPRLSIRPYDSLQDDLARLLLMHPSSASRQSARLAIVSCAIQAVSGPALPIVATAAVIGARAVSVSELASACRIGPRTLQSRLSSAGLTTPKTLL